MPAGRPADFAAPDLGKVSRPRAGHGPAPADPWGRGEPRHRPIFGAERVEQGRGERRTGRPIRQEVQLEPPADRPRR